MKKITLQFLLLFGVMAFAQVTNERTAPSWDLNLKKAVAPKVMPSFDLQALIDEDRTQDQLMTKPLRFGHEFDVDFDTYNSGVWETLDNGDRIWKINIISNGAKTMNLLFDYYYLPEGGKVFIYNNDRTDIIGAYTHTENQEDGVLGTWIVKGSNVWVEYYEPKNVQGLGRLSIDKVVHGYRGFGMDDELKLNESGNCNVDVNCNPNVGGATIDWAPTRDNYRHAVARIIINGSGLCTGTLVNNQRQDGTPYFLTAHHCLGVGNNDGATVNGNNWAFGFEWYTNTPDCATNANTSGPANPTNVITGATLRANKFGSDVALFELNQTPNMAWDLYYAGWDNTNNVPTTQFGVHHPSGDIMKIARNDQSATSGNVNIGGQIADCWTIADWDYGVTEGGSSGSCLVDQNGRIIGQLFGGGAACSGTNDNGAPDYYGRFGTSWDTGTANNTQLKHWLDPDNTGVSTLDGSFHSTLSVDDFALANGVSIYPNPASNELNIVLSSQLDNLGYTLYNNLGQVLINGNLDVNTENKLQVNSLTPGMYFLNVSDKSGKASITKKIIIE